MVLYIDVIVLLQPTSPLRKVEDIDGAIKLCMERQAKSCVSVNETEHSPYWMYSLDNKDVMTPLLKISAGESYQRQKLPKVYRLNGAVYVADRNFLKSKRTFIDSETLGYVMPQERSLDIDTMLDFSLIELIKGRSDNL